MKNGHVLGRGMPDWQQNYSDGTVLEEWRRYRSNPSFECKTGYISVSPVLGGSKIY